MKTKLLALALALSVATCASLASCGGESSSNPGPAVSTPVSPQSTYRIIEEPPQASATESVESVKIIIAQPTAEEKAAKDTVSAYLAQSYDEDDIVNVYIREKTVEAAIKIQVSLDDERPDDWDSTIDAAISVGKGILSSLPDGVEKSSDSLYLLDLSGRILLTVSNGKLVYDAYEDPELKTKTIPESKPQIPSAGANVESRTVYVTKTGKHYHYDNHCNGGTYYKSTLEDAKSRGLTPCEKCT